MSKSHLSTRRPLALLGSAAVALGIAIAAPTTATALSGNCNAWLVNNVGSTHAVGVCHSLGRDTKARVTLDLEGGPDYHSNWFYDIGVHHSTRKWSLNPNYPPNGWPRSARVDLAPR